MGLDPMKENDLEEHTGDASAAGHAIDHDDGDHEDSDHEDGNHEASYLGGEHHEYWEIQLVEAKADLLKYAARLINGGNEEAGDLFSDLAVRILKYNKDPKTLDKEPIAYLKTSMHNGWNDRLRRKIRAGEEGLEGENGELKPRVHPTVRPAAERLVENRELLALLMRHKGPLTAREDFILMERLAGASNEEIAAQLNTSVEVVAVEWNAVNNKVRYRLKTRCFNQKMSQKHVKGGRS